MNAKQNFRARIEKKVRADVAAGIYGACDEDDIRELIEEELEESGFFDRDEACYQAANDDTPCVAEVANV